MHGKELREMARGLANRRLQPLGHLTAEFSVYVSQAVTRKGLCLCSLADAGPCMDDDQAAGEDPVGERPRLVLPAEEHRARQRFVGEGLRSRIAGLGRDGLCPR